MTNNSTNMSVSSTHLDLAGNLVIKARFNNNFKKTTINNDELTYDELILMLQRLFNGRFDAKDDVKLKYRDEDGDLVDIDNDSDLKSAIQCNRYLKLVISLGEDEDDVSLLDDRVSLSKKEFRKLTETMEKILESLKTNEPVKPENSTNSSFEPLNNDQPVHHTLNNLTLSDSKEFDPLVNKADKSEKSTIVQEEESIKSLNSNSLQRTLSAGINNEKQPATLQPSAQQFQSTQNLQSKILNQSQQQFQQLNQPQIISGQITHSQQQQHQQQIQHQHQQQIQHQQQHQQQIQPPMPYRYGMPPSSNANQPPNSRPVFNPNELPAGSSHPPSSYPTPSSTPAFGMQPQLNNPPGQQLSYPPMSTLPPPTSMNTSIPQLTSPPQSNTLQSGSASAFGPPPTGPIPQHLQQGSPNQPPPSQNGPPPTSMPSMSLPNPASGAGNQQLPQNGMPPSSTMTNNAPMSPPQSNQQQNLQGPPQFTNFMPPTGPYPGQQAPKNNPFSRVGQQQARYAYPQQQQPQQFN